MLPLLPPKCLHQTYIVIAVVVVVASLLLLLLMTSLTKLKSYRQLLLCCTAKCWHAHTRIHTHMQTQWDDSPSCGVHCCNTMDVARCNIVWLLKTGYALVPASAIAKVRQQLFAAAHRHVYFRTCWRSTAGTCRPKVWRAYLSILKGTLGASPAICAARVFDNRSHKGGAKCWEDNKVIKVISRLLCEN